MPCTISPIHTDTEHKQALKRLSQLMKNPAPEDHDEIEVLAILIEAYESEHYPIRRATPLEVLQFHMEQNNSNPKTWHHWSVDLAEPRKYSRVSATYQNA